MISEEHEAPEAGKESRSLFWPRMRLLLIGGAALGLLVLMCGIVALVAYLR